MMPPLRPTPNTSLSENVFGRRLADTSGREGWRHPWFTRVEWNPNAKEFRARVRAGFVNGRAPMVRTTVGAMQGTFFGQLVDAKSGAAEIEQLARLAAEGDESDTTPVDVPLYERPPIGLNAWRPIGFDGVEKAPQFFLDRGAANPPASAASQIVAGQPVDIASLEAPKGLRLLRACDIILHQPRTALTSNIEIDPSGAVSGLGMVNQTLGFREPSEGDRLKVVTGKYDPQQSLNYSPNNLNLIASSYEEKTWDELLIATVYLLSPADWPVGQPIDSSWTPFVRHGLFWNLFWAQKQLQPVFNTDIFRPLVALTGILAGGAGIGAVSWLASSINDATQGAANILQAQSLAGSFWTATGVGATGAVTLAKTTADPELRTLDKAARVAAKAAKAAAARRAVTLDPEFPYDGRTFNLSLLTT